MKYFWQTRTPDETARDVNAALAAYLRDWGKDRLILIGYSFGAAVLPFILSRLPEELKTKVALAVLLGSNTYANWEIHWGDWLHDQPHESARPVAPNWTRSRASSCCASTAPTKPRIDLSQPAGRQGFEILGLPGGHHFDGNYKALADQILLADSAIREGFTPTPNPSPQGRGKTRLSTSSPLWGGPGWGCLPSNVRRVVGSAVEPGIAAVKRPIVVRRILHAGILIVVLARPS